VVSIYLALWTKISVVKYKSIYIISQKVRFLQIRLCDIKTNI